MPMLRRLAVLLHVQVGMGVFSLIAGGNNLQPAYTNTLSSQVPMEPRAPWHVISGNWLTGKDGLSGRNVGVVALDQRLGKDWRIEYDAWTTDERPCDLSLVIGDYADGKLTNRYSFGFGAQRNSQNFYMEPGGSPVQSKPGDIVLITPGKRHRVAVEKTGALVRMFVDGKQQFEVTVVDPRALEGIVSGILYLFKRIFCQPEC